jgi:hypothetical protein
LAAKDRKPRPAPVGLSRLRRSATASAESADFTGGFGSGPATATLAPLAAPTTAPAAQDQPEPQAEPPAQRPAEPETPSQATTANVREDEPATKQTPEASSAGQPEPPAQRPAEPETPSQATTANVREDEPATKQTPEASAAEQPRSRRAGGTPSAQKASSSRRAAPRTQQLAAPAARKAVVDSYLSARHRPHEWVPAGIRLPIDLRHRLEERLLTDQDSTGNYQLALAHYVNAALDLIPDDDVETSSEWARGYLESLGMARPRTTGTGTRLHGDVELRMKRLTARLRRHSRYGLVGHLHAAAVVRLLDALDEE